MKRTASAQRLIETAEEHTVNGLSICARLVALLGGKPVATGADVAEALSGATKPLGSKPFSFDPETAKHNA